VHPLAIRATRFRSASSLLRLANTHLGIVSLGVLRLRIGAHSPMISRMPIHALNHVGISTPDLARSLAFWADLLGFEQVSGFSWDVGTTPADEGLGLIDSAADVAILNAGNVFLEILQFRSPTPVPQRLDHPRTDRGINYVALEVADVDVVLQRLRDAGVVIDRTPENSLDGSVRTATVRDPDGNVVDLRRTLAPDSALAGARLHVTATPPRDGQLREEADASVGEISRDVLGISIVGVSTPDVDVHASFYRDPAALAEVIDGRDLSSIVLSAGNMFVDFSRCESNGTSIQSGPKRVHDHGFNHLCFDVSGIDELHAHLVENGMTYHRAPTAMPAGNSIMGYATDPIGIPVELLENRSTKAFLWCGLLHYDVG
jgi:catechol 2,3-dioxygenase-like lactoylglutathione lyase family enzyme